MHCWRQHFVMGESNSRKHLASTTSGTFPLIFLLPRTLFLCYPQACLLPSFRFLLKYPPCHAGSLWAIPTPLASYCLPCFVLHNIEHHLTPSKYNNRNFRRMAILFLHCFSQCLAHRKRSIDIDEWMSVSREEGRQACYMWHILSPGIIQASAFFQSWE